MEGHSNPRGGGVNGDGTILCQWDGLDVKLSHHHSVPIISGIPLG